MAEENPGFAHLSHGRLSCSEHSNGRSMACGLWLQWQLSPLPIYAPLIKDHSWGYGQEDVPPKWQCRKQQTSDRMQRILLSGCTLIQSPVTRSDREERGIITKIFPCKALPVHRIGYCQHTGTHRRPLTHSCCPCLTSQLLPSAGSP